RRPPVERGAIVLPAGALERVERHAIAFSQHAETLVAAGRSLHRGVLLYGPPGTGKTLTVMYLATKMPGRTVLLTTGLGLGRIAAIGQFARDLAPATVVVEDVDLIAQERGLPGGQTQPLLSRAHEPDGWPRRRRRRALPAHDEPARHPRAGARRAPRARRSRARAPGARRHGKAASPRAVRARPRYGRREARRLRRADRGCEPRVHQGAPPACRTHRDDRGGHARSRARRAHPPSDGGAEHRWRARQADRRLQDRGVPAARAVGR